MRILVRSVVPTHSPYASKSPSSPCGRSPKGQVVGNSLLSAGGNGRAFIWTDAGGMVTLGILPGFTGSGVHRINNLGQAVGYCSQSEANHGFVWSSTGGMEPLGTLPGGLSSDAVGINDLGDDVGTSDSGAGTKVHAVLWNRARIISDLGLLAGGTWSSAFAINIFGTVVGNADCANSKSHAFVWSAERGMRDFNVLIPANSGWELSIARAINVAGGIIGDGTVNGQQHIFLLTPQCVRYPFRPAFQVDHTGRDLRHDGNECAERQCQQN